MVKIAPSILSADFANLADDVIRVQEAGADLLHIDVMDGHFVPNITFGPVVIRSIKDRVDLPFDVHLMIEEPEKYISEFADAGADLLTVHAETQPHLQRTLQAIRDHGMKAGVSLNPSTPLSFIDWVLHDLDLVLIMTVNPGFGGQSFIPTMIPKIEELAGLLEEEGLEEVVDIEVDGGVTPETAPLVVDAGADILVAGSFVFKGPDGVDGNMAALRKVVEETLADEPEASLEDIM